jgi:hypothetical protein
VSPLGLDWSELKKLSLWVTIAVPVVLTGFVTFLITWGSAQTHLEQLEKRQDRFEASVQKSMDGLQKGIEGRFDASARDERDQTASFQSSIRDLETNVMLLCGGQRRPLAKVCDVKALVAQARSVSRSQAVLLEGATVQITAGEKPQVASEEVKEQLPQEVTWGDTGVTTYYPGGKKLGDVLLWSAAAKSAHWSEEGDYAKASFANGYATFKFAPATSREHMRKFVDSLNATTEVLKAPESGSPEKK